MTPDRSSPLIRSSLIAALFLPFASGCASIPAKSTIDGYTIETKVIDSQPGVATRVTVKLADVTAAFPKYISSTYAYAGQNGGKFAGKPFAIYHRMTADEFDIAFGCPLEKAIPGNATFQSINLPGGNVVMTTHRGSYHELGKAHAVMEKWFEVFGLERNGPPWEVYVDDPTAVAPDQVRTLVYYPIK